MNDPYNALKTTLKAEIDRQAWESLHSALSRPFDKPKSRRILQLKGERKIIPLSFSVNDRFCLQLPGHQMAHNMPSNSSVPPPETLVSRSTVRRRLLVCKASWANAT
jgi:hypothetical protein